ncbi:glycosyltransferase [Pasteurellaceae bacterium USgator11]|nr:glycosyltransferase [Pasteurellaceae bacterium UScroc12]TNG98308.1 glycosyltransferase [Pasteurellaceae bacterium USgator41]TNH01564.1 glycosyltransferase [Pasteurellaceae bacterium UScroc31]TNH02251.1 glycosyltransferase [Pasteurellaceae bacterium USgator11]
MQQTICLNMIVKNEENIIQDTLHNIIQHINIDYWVIADTGSSDNTIKLITDFFAEKNIKGEIHQHDWLNFSHNRNLALNLCQGKSDYIFIFDADDRFNGSFKLPSLTEDSYYFLMSNQGTEYQRPLLIKNNGQFFWRSVLHEFLQSKQKNPSKALISGDYHIVSGRFGHRSQDPEKYLKDAKLLESAYQQNEDEDLKPRYAFYCAQSYRDAEYYQQAIEWYLKRIELGGWIEEVTCAYESLGICYEHLNDNKSAIYYWLAGYDYNPNRIECLYNAVRLLRIQGKCKLAYQLGIIAKNIPFPKNDILFVKKSIHDFWIDFELSISAYYVNDFQLGYQCCKKILFSHPEPHIRDITINNLKFYQQQAAQDSVSEVNKLLDKLTADLSPKNNVTATEIIEYLKSL